MANGDLERAREGKCFKHTCGAEAARFFLVNLSAPGQPNFVALCGPCAERWIADAHQGFKPMEVPLSEFLELAEVSEVLGD